MAPTQHTSFCGIRGTIVMSACICMMIAYLLHLFRSGEIDPVVFTIPPAQEIPASAQVSDNLSKLKKIHLGQYTAPKSLVVVDGAIYTGVQEAKILKINESGVHEFAVLHPPNCKSVSECGRPNGIRLSPDGKHLIVADAYLGIFSISIDNGEVKKLFPLKDDIKITSLNDFDFLPNGSVIVSESSVKYPKDMFFHDLMEGRANGRLLYVDLKTGEWHQVLDNLYYPSGIQLHSDNHSVLVAEVTTYRILKVPLDGGSRSIFIDGLQGSPGKIRPSPRGGYWMPVSHLRDTWVVKFADWSAQYPVFRNALFKLSMLPMFNFIQLTTSSALLRYDDNGVLVEAVLDPEYNLPNVLEATEVDGQLFTTSYFLPYVGHVQL